MKSSLVILAAAGVVSAAFSPNDLPTDMASCGTCKLMAGVQFGERATFNADCINTGGKGCISLKRGDSDPEFNGCQFCGFGEYAEIPCENDFCLNEELQMEDASSCAARARGMERVTFDPECIRNGGKGCFSVSGPGINSIYDGCRYCEFDQYADIKCKEGFTPPVGMPSFGSVGGMGGMGGVQLPRAAMMDGATMPSFGTATMPSFGAQPSFDRGFLTAPDRGQLVEGEDTYDEGELAEAPVSPVTFLGTTSARLGMGQGLGGGLFGGGGFGGQGGGVGGVFPGQGGGVGGVFPGQGGGVGGIFPGGGFGGGMGGGIFGGRGGGIFGGRGGGGGFGGMFPGQGGGVGGVFPGQGGGVGGIFPGGGFGYVGTQQPLAYGARAQPVSVQYVPSQLQRVMPL